MFSNIRSAAASVFGASPKQKRKATAPPEPPEGNRRVLRRRVVPDEVYHGRKGRSSAEGSDADGGGSNDAGRPNTRGRASRRRGGREVDDDEMQPSTSKIPAESSSSIAGSQWELEDAGLDVMCLLMLSISNCSPQDAANAALVSSRWREMMGPQAAVTSALQRFGQYSDDVDDFVAPTVGKESIGDACAAMRHLISLPKEEARKWLLANPFGGDPKGGRFSYVADLICVQDRLARALALQVLAIVRDCLDEKTVSVLMENVVGYFAHMDFMKGEPTVHEVSERMRFIAELVETFCMGYPSAVARGLFELLLEPEDEWDWDLHHLATPYACKALVMIIERKPKETARHVHLVRDLLTVTEHSWLEKRELRLGPSEVKWCTEKGWIPDQVSIMRAAGITLIATFGKSAKEYLPMVAELLRDQRVIAPGQGLPGVVDVYGRDMTISMLAVQILGSQFITPAMAREFLPVVSAMLNDVDLNTRIAALRTLGRLGGRGADARVSDLVDRLEDTSSVARCEAIGALVNLSPSAVRPHVEAVGRLLWDSHPDVCASAVEALGWFGRNGLAAEVPPDHVNELVNLLEDEDDEVVRAVVPALKDLKHLLQQSHVDQILQYLCDDDDDMLVSMALRAIELLGADFFIRRGAFEFLLGKAEESEFVLDLSSATSEALSSLAGGITEKIFNTSILNRLKSIKTAKFEDNLRPWTVATFALASIRGKTQIKRRTAEQTVTLVSHIFESPHATAVDVRYALAALQSHVAAIAHLQTIRVLVNLLRDLPSVVFIKTGKSRAKKETAKHAKGTLETVLDELLPSIIGYFWDASARHRLKLDMPFATNKKEMCRLLATVVLAVCEVIELAFKRGQVDIALKAMDCLLEFKETKDERNVNVAAGTINTILPLLLGGSKKKGVCAVYSDVRMREFCAQRYLEILRWNPSVVTPEHVEALIGSIKMPFSVTPRTNGSKMRVVMRAIEGMSEGHAQPLVDKIVEKFAPWKSTTRCWRAGVWMIRVLATCPPGCSVPHADIFKTYMMTCLDRRGDLMKDGMERENLAWAMLVVADSKIAHFEASMGSLRSAAQDSSERWVPRNVSRKNRRGDAIAPLLPLVVDKWLVNSSDREKRLARIVLHRLKPQALKQFFRHRAEHRRELECGDYFERTGEVDADELAERFLRQFDPEHYMDFDDDDTMYNSVPASDLDDHCDCPNCIGRRMFHFRIRRQSGDVSDLYLSDHSSSEEGRAGASLRFDEDYSSDSDD